MFTHYFLLTVSFFLFMSTSETARTRIPPPFKRGLMEVNAVFNVRVWLFSVILQVSQDLVKPDGPVMA